MALLLAAAGPPPSATPAARLDDPAWRARFAAKQVELRQKRPEVVFLGDSIFQNWEKQGGPAWDDYRPGWERYFDRFDAVDLGFTGDTTANLLWRVENGELDAIHPKVAVVLIGINDFCGAGWSAGDTLAGIDAVLAAMRRRAPGTKILLLGLLPNGWCEAARSGAASVDRALAARHWAGSGVTYRDLSELLAPHGVLDRSRFADPLFAVPGPPLHPTAQTQVRLAAAIAPAIAALLGAAAK